MIAPEFNPHDKEKEEAVNKDFENAWQEIYDTPVDRFREVLAGEVLDQSCSWDLPDGYAAIIRVQNPKTYKVTERVFKKTSAARRFVENQEANGFVVTAYDRDQLYCSQGFTDEEE